MSLHNATCDGYVSFTVLGDAVLMRDGTALPTQHDDCLLRAPESQHITPVGG